MSGFLVLDTESNGLFNYALPADAEGQPRIASVSFIFVSPDLQVIREYDALVRPEGWTFDNNSEAARVNGLTQEHLIAEGKPIQEILKVYTGAVDEGFVVVAFNSQHDTKMLRGELRRADMDDRFERTPNICVMRALTDICKIPKANGKGYKFPKLSEAMAALNIKQDGAHTAGGDARSALELFRVLKNSGRCPEPSVNYAKEKVG